MVPAQAAHEAGGGAARAQQRARDARRHLLAAGGEEGHARPQGVAACLGLGLGFELGLGFGLGFGLGLGLGLGLGIGLGYSGSPWHTDPPGLGYLGRTLIVLITQIPPMSLPPDPSLLSPLRPLLAP